MVLNHVFVGSFKNLKFSFCWILRHLNFLILLYRVHFIKSEAGEWSRKLLGGRATKKLVISANVLKWGSRAWIAPSEELLEALRWKLNSVPQLRVRPYALNLLQRWLKHDKFSLFGKETPHFLTLRFLVRLLLSYFFLPLIRLIITGIHPLTFFTL